MLGLESRLMEDIPSEMSSLLIRPLVMEKSEKSSEYMMTQLTKCGR